jgi:hypothetical protein
VAVEEEVAVRKVDHLKEFALAKWAIDYFDCSTQDDMHPVIRNP